MRRARYWLETLHAAALGAWAAAIACAGASAAIIFPGLKALNPTLPEFSAYTGPHWRLAAGVVQQKIFRATDALQLGTMGLALVTFVAIFGRLAALRAWSRLVRRVFAWRAALLGLTLCFGLVYGLVFAPALQRGAEAIVSAARAGDTDRAETLRGEFDAQHPGAIRLLAAALAGTLASLALGVWSVRVCESEERRGRGS